MSLYLRFQLPSHILSPINRYRSDSKYIHFTPYTPLFIIMLAIFHASSGISYMSLILSIKLEVLPILSSFLRFRLLFLKGLPHRQCIWLRIICSLFLMKIKTQKKIGSHWLISNQFKSGLRIMISSMEFHQNGYCPQRTKASILIYLT